jgi:C_GCAxxG_C_C family probable redox protein
MDITEKVSKAESLFKEGYNCSQAVIAAFCEECSLDFDTAVRLSSSFGGGMGRLREVCGAVSAMFMVAGLKLGYFDPNDAQKKKEHYELIQKLAAKFREENGSILCRDLLSLPGGPDDPKPEVRTEQYYQNRPCAEYVAFAAKITAELLNSVHNG